MGSIVYARALYREWLQHNYNWDEQICDTQIVRLEKLWTNYCKIIGEKINVSNLRKVSIPYSCDLNPYIWICDCVNHGDYKFCKHIINLYVSLLKRLFFELTYDTTEYDYRESSGYTDGYKPKISYGESYNDRLTQYQDLIINDINAVYPNVIMYLNMNGNLPTEVECSSWIKALEIYSKFIHSLISSFDDDKYHYYHGTSEVLDHLKLQDYFESNLSEDD